MHLASALAFTSEELSPGEFQNFCARIDPEWIYQALLATGTATIRKRRLPAEQVIWLVLGMGLMRNIPIVDVVDKLDLALPDEHGPVAASAVAKARARLGDQPLEWLFVRSADAWAHASAAAHAWRGLALYGVDGSTLRVADSDENCEFFGKTVAGAGRGPSGYPLARIVTLMALRSHLIAAASFGPFDDEWRYANDLWPSLPSNSLLLVDKLFFNAGLFVPLVRDGKNRHWMTRARRNNKWRVVEKLARGDEIVEFEVSTKARRRDPSLPRTFRARAVRYQRKGYEPGVLLTSLTDDKKYPAEDLVALYHERWEIELGYDELKTEMLEREEALRSRSPVGVRQELWGVLLAYNLVRLEMERIADEAGVPPTQISFVGALRFMRDQWLLLCGTRTPGRIPGQLREMRDRIKRLVLPKRRSERSYPRVVKIKMSGYNLKRSPTGMLAK